MPHLSLPYHLMTSLPVDSPAVNVLNFGKALHLNDSRARIAFWVAAVAGGVAVFLTFAVGKLAWLAVVLSFGCVVATVMMSIFRSKTRDVRKFYVTMTAAVLADLEAGATFSDEEMSVFNAMATNAEEGGVPIAQSAVTGILIGVLVIFLPMRLSFESDGSESGAVNACESVVASQLKDPSSASFRNSTAYETGRREWLVRGMVSGTNSFGLTVAAPYVCSVNWDGSDYTAVGYIED